MTTGQPLAPLNDLLQCGTLADKHSLHINPICTYVYVLQYKQRNVGAGGWLSGCRSSIIEDRPLKPSVFGSILVTAGFYQFSPIDINCFFRQHKHSQQLTSISTLTQGRPPTQHDSISKLLSSPAPNAKTGA